MRASVPALLLLMMAGCGGGGGGGGGGPPPAVTFQLSSTHVSFSGVVNGSIPATQTVTATAQNGTVYFATTFKNGTAPALSNAGGSCSGTTSTCAISIAPLSPVGQSAGTYTATVTVTGCTNAVCSSQVTGSPQTIEVTYNITSGPTLTVTNSLVGVLTHPGDAIAPLTISLGSTSGSAAWISSVQYSGGTSGWLQVPASGTAPGAIQAAVANLALGGYQASVTFTPTAGGTPVTVFIDAASRPAGVTYVAPYVGYTGIADTAILRGNGFASLQSPQVSFGATPASSVQVVSDTEIHAAYPALTAGSYPVTLSDATTTLASRAALAIVNAPAYAYTVIARDPTAPNPVFSSERLIYDAPRAALYLYNFNNNPSLPRSDEIWAYRFNGALWTSSRLTVFAQSPLTGNSALKFAPDGTELLRVANSAVDHVDPLSGTLLTTTALGGTLGAYTLLNRAGLTDDGYLLGNAYTQNANAGTMYLYDVLARAFVPTTTPSGPTDFVNTDFHASGDGGRIVMTFLGFQPIYLYDASSGTYTASALNANSPSIVSVNRTGTRALIQLGSTQVSVVDFPSSIYSYLPATLAPDACVISPDGTRAYAYVSSGNTIHVFDLTTVVNGLAPEIGSGTALPDSPGTGVAMTITADGGTLILAGTANVIITPHP